MLPEGIQGTFIRGKELTDRETGKIWEESQTGSIIKDDKRRKIMSLTPYPE